MALPPVKPPTSPAAKPSAYNYGTAPSAAPTRLQAAATPAAAPPKGLITQSGGAIRQTAAPPGPVGNMVLPTAPTDTATRLRTQALAGAGQRPLAGNYGVPPTATPARATLQPATQSGIRSAYTPQMAAQNAAAQQAQFAKMVPAEQQRYAQGATQAALAQRMQAMNPQQRAAYAQRVQAASAAEAARPVVANPNLRATANMTPAQQQQRFTPQQAAALQQMTPQQRAQFAQQFQAQGPQQAQQAAPQGNAARAQAIYAARVQRAPAAPTAAPRPLSPTTRVR